MRPETEAEAKLHIMGIERVMVLRELQTIAAHLGTVTNSLDKVFGSITIIKQLVIGTITEENKDDHNSTETRLGTGDLAR